MEKLIAYLLCIIFLILTAYLNHLVHKLRNYLYLDEKKVELEKIKRKAIAQIIRNIFSRDRERGDDLLVELSAIKINHIDEFENAIRYVDDLVKSSKGFHFKIF
tara:strand:+ start:1533 stop:1844 length:312 start_codon:yes stop_codon:yes gene_type:complete